MTGLLATLPETQGGYVLLLVTLGVFCLGAFVLVGLGLAALLFPAVFLLRRRACLCLEPEPEVTRCRTCARRLDPKEWTWE